MILASVSVGLDAADQAVELGGQGAKRLHRIAYFLAETISPGTVQDRNYIWIRGVSVESME